MAEALILDSEAVNALAHATERAALAERSRAILQIAHERQALVRVPAPVLAEVCRGSRFDAAVDRLLKDRGIRVCVLTQSIAQRAGGLLAKAKLPSAHAVDAFVVATALEFDAAVIATGDPREASFPFGHGHLRARQAAPALAPPARPLRLACVHAMFTLIGNGASASRITPHSPPPRPPSPRVQNAAYIELHMQLARRSSGGKPERPRLAASFAARKAAVGWP